MLRTRRGRYDEREHAFESVEASERPRRCGELRRLRSPSPYPGPMRSRTGVTASLALGIAAAQVLTGCSTSSPQPTATAPTASPSATAVFESKEEAIAAAKALYRKYLLVGQAVSENGGRNVELLKPIVSAKEYEIETASSDRQRARGLRTDGPTKLLTFRLQRANLATGDITAYACIDVAQVRVLDQQGRNVTPKKRADRLTFQPSFQWQDDQLILRENSTWSGAPIC